MSADQRVVPCGPRPPPPCAAVRAERANIGAHDKVCPTVQVHGPLLGLSRASRDLCQLRAVANTEANHIRVEAAAKMSLRAAQLVRCLLWSGTGKLTADTDDLAQSGRHGQRR